MNLDELFLILSEKTEEGIEKLKSVEIGTEEYELLVRQIISNINLAKERGKLEEGNQPKQFDPQSVIGKEFK